MKINGYKVQHALRELEQAREVAAQQFADNIMQFDSQDEKVELKEVFGRYTAMEKKIAQLQVVQAKYNMSVLVNVLGEAMPLHEAVKLVGGAGRAEKMWRDVVKGQRGNRYHSPETTRTKDTEYAKRAVSLGGALEQAKFASKVAGALRQAIQLGNATELDFKDLEPSLLES